MITPHNIRSSLERMGGYKNICIPEFTWKELRIDALMIDIAHRWIRGFEIKTERSDFLRDIKWPLYSQFCSSLSIVCPEELIDPKEIEKPFGLIWVKEENLGGRYGINYKAKWVKRPKNFQKRTSLAWIWVYIRVLELELPRLQFENMRLREKNG